MKTIARKTWNEPVYGANDGVESSTAKFAGYVEHVNDIKLDQRGNVMFNTEAEAVADRVDAAVKTHLGELQLNIEKGIDYEDTIFKHRKYAQQWANQMREAILNDEEVERVDSFDYEIDGETLKYTVVFTTTYGTTETVTNG